MTHTDPLPSRLGKHRPQSWLASHERLAVSRKLFMAGRGGAPRGNRLQGLQRDSPRACLLGGPRTDTNGHKTEPGMRLWSAAGFCPPLSCHRTQRRWGWNEEMPPSILPPRKGRQTCCAGSSHLFMYLEPDY